MRLLLIEDNTRLSELIESALVKDGFAVDAAFTSLEAREFLNNFHYDLVLLDLSLPDGDGLDLIAKISSGITPVPPILVMTARGGLNDRVKGLNHGADDYLVKPFAPEELIARCRALLRRPGSVLGHVLKLGNVSFNTSAREVDIDGRRVSLPPREMAFLEHMMRHANQVIPRTHLETSLYSADQPVSPNALEASASRLRRWIKDKKAKIELHTSHGIGYVLTTREGHEDIENQGSIPN